MPFTALQSAFDSLFPAGLQWYWKADFFTEISDPAIETHLKYGKQLPTGLSGMHLYPIDGAVSRVPHDATAFAWRDGGWAGVIADIDPDPANAGRMAAWAQDYWQDLHPAAAGGGYVNFLMDKGQDRVKAAYRGNYDRLARIKNRYDPATSSTSTRTSSQRNPRDRPDRGQPAGAAADPPPGRRRGQRLEAQRHRR